MKVNFYIIIILFLVFSAVGYGANAPTQATEPEIKAVFLYNFLKFTDWPSNKIAEKNSMTIGILGEHQFGNAFDAVKDKLIREKKLSIKDFGQFSKFISNEESGSIQFTGEIEQLKKCHLLFVCNSEKKYYAKIIDAVKDANVLTVGETEDFLDFGGIITFIPGTEKPVFEINIAAAKHAKIQINSRVLRLARKVRGEESAYQMEAETSYARLDLSAGQ